MKFKKCKVIPGGLKVEATTLDIKSLDVNFFKLHDFVAVIDKQNKRIKELYEVIKK